MTAPTNGHPPINFAKLPPVDLDRFGRAMTLTAKPLPGSVGQYKVIHADEPLRQEHYVDLVSEDVPRCDCGDYLYRECLCKHILAALIREGHPVTAEAMARWVAERRGKP